MFLDVSSSSVVVSYSPSRIFILYGNYVANAFILTYCKQCIPTPLFLEEWILSQDSNTTNSKKYASLVPHKQTTQDFSVRPAFNYKPGKKGHISCIELQGQFCWFINSNVASDHKSNLTDLVM